MKANVLTRLADGARGFRKVLNWDEQVRLKVLLGEGWKIESHGSGGVVLFKRPHSIPAIFGGTKK